MTPEEKINYALSLVEGDTPWRLGLARVRRRSDYGDVENAEDDRRIMVSANRIALSPLIPAALRLALAAQVARNNVSGTPAEEEDRQLWASLDAFLALLPEPPKEG